MPNQHTPIRAVSIVGDTAYLTLTKGFVATIDAADVAVVINWNWTSLVRPHTVYAYRKQPKASGRGNILLHRAILGVPEGVEVDHRNGDGLDNRRSNLRIATPAQNSQNKRLYGRNKSGFKGVHWVQEKSRWQAQIMAAGSRRHLGYFTRVEEAAEAYAKASVEMHGDFGRLA